MLNDFLQHLTLAFQQGTASNFCIMQENRTFMDRLKAPSRSPAKESAPAHKSRMSAKVGVLHAAEPVETCQGIGLSPRERDLEDEHADCTNRFGRQWPLAGKSP